MRQAAPGQAAAPSRTPCAAAALFPCGGAPFSTSAIPRSRRSSTTSTACAPLKWSWRNGVPEASSQTASLPPATQPSKPCAKPAAGPSRRITRPLRKRRRAACAASITGRPLPCAPSPASPGGSGPCAASSGPAGRFRRPPPPQVPSRPISPISTSEKLRKASSVPATGKACTTPSRTTPARETHPPCAGSSCSSPRPRAPSPSAAASVTISGKPGRAAFPSTTSRNFSPRAAS